MKVDYPYRLLLDYEFVNEVVVGNFFSGTKKHDMLKRLMYIKATSSTNKGNHNIILEDQFSRLKKDKIMSEEELRRIVYPAAIPDRFNKIGENLERNIVMAVMTTNDPPWNCIILTSTQNEKDYKANKHFKNMQDVRVASGDEAYNSIRLLFTLYDASLR